MPLRHAAKCAVFAGLVPALPLFAQGGLNEKGCVIWDGQSVILPVHPNTPSDAKSVRVEGPGGGTVKTISLPSAAFRRDCLNGSLYAFGMTDKKDERPGGAASVTQHVLWRRDSGDWTVDATIDAPRATFFSIVPLKNGKYLLVALRPFIEDAGGAHLFGIYKKNKKQQLELEAPVTNAFARPFWTKADMRSQEKGFFRVGLFCVCRTDAKIIVAFQNIGWFFVFSPEDGRLLRKSSVYPEITEEAIFADRRFGKVGLGIEPRQDGRVVCATMSKEYAVLAMDVLPAPSFGDLDNTLRLQVDTLRDLEDKRLGRWPEVAWWDFDPDTGKFAGAPAPDGFPKTLKTLREAWDFRWRMRADGSLALTDQDGGVAEKRPRRILGLFDLR